LNFRHFVVVDALPQFNEEWPGISPEMCVEIPVCSSTEAEEVGIGHFLWFNPPRFLNFTPEVALTPHDGVLFGFHDYGRWPSSVTDRVLSILDRHLFSPFLGSAVRACCECHRAQGKGNQEKRDYGACQFFVR
jgi:hypothetical protein